MIFCDNDYQYLKSKNLNNHIRKQKTRSAESTDLRSGIKLI